MKDKEKENLKNMEKNNTNSMDEKVHYEIKFVETEDGYRLEASGDKETLKRLGIGPNMVPNLGGRKRRPGRGRRARHGRRMRHRRQAAMARGARRMNQAWQFAGAGRPGFPGPGFGARGRFHDPRCTRHDTDGYGKESGEKGHTDTWEW